MPQRRRGQVDGPIEFFKIILDPSAPEQSLPRAFLKDHGEEVPRHSILISPTGREWPVVVSSENADGERFFRKGWPQSRDHHCIKMGYFIIFSYDMAHTFSTKIFDLSCTIHKYPKDHDDYLKPPLAANPIDGAGPSTLRAVKTEEVDVHVEGDSQAQTDVVAFMATIPSSVKFFHKELTATDVTGSCQLIVPKKTADIIFTRKRCTVSVTVRGTGTSLTKYIDFSVGDKKTRANAGWKAFVKEFQLKTGDTIVFVVDNNNAESWDAKIFHS